MALPRRLAHDMDMPQPRIKRYALVPESRDGRIRRFQLARVAPTPRSALGADRLERMEEVAAREERGDYGPAGGTGPQTT
jgi:hypothetical protein